MALGLWPIGARSVTDPLEQAKQQSFRTVDRAPQGLPHGTDKNAIYTEAFAQRFLFVRKSEIDLLVRPDQLFS